MKKLINIVLLFPLMIVAQSTNENYIKTIQYKKASTQGSFDITQPENATTTVTYFDGIGRPIQKIAIAQSNTNKNIVTPIVYDPLEKKILEYLPYVSTSLGMGFESSSETNDLNFYQNPSLSTTGNPNFESTTNPYIEKLISSPLSRVLEQAAPGNDWSMNNSVKHTVRMDYQTNTAADAVKLFSVIANWDPIKALYDIPTSLTPSNYADFQLYKTIIKDENWVTANGTNNTSEEFKNKEGRIILKRTYNVRIAHDTYYIYDQFGNLTYVIPPKADANITQTVLDELCYQYKYDYKNRLVEKKLPGKQWEFIVYDKLDRVVATGPVLSPFTDLQTIAPATPIVGWMITKYDIFNRSILTGWLQSTTVSSDGRKSLQELYNDINLSVSETKTTTDTSINSVNVRYTNDAIPISIANTYHVLTVNYFDSYITNLSFPSSIDFTSPIYTTSISPNPVYYNNTTGTVPQGLPTISWTRIPEISTATATNIKAEMSYFLYDNKARVIRTYTQNYLGGFTQVDSQLEPITGRVNYTIETHKRLATDNVLTVRNDFTYSAQDRLLTHMHTINNGTPELLSDNAYDELGQLITKKVGNTISTPLQKIDYRYNIRGWLLAINDPYDLKLGTENDMFAISIKYNSPIEYDENGRVKPLYNGNIAETTWRTANDDILRRYVYKYDSLNRLTGAIYQRPDSAVIVPNSYNESASYDKNGNIMYMQRNGDFDDAVNVLDIDRLTYSYDQSNTTNRLMKVTDSTNSTIGFKDDSTGYNDTVDDFSYDANGNMIKDDNKGITNIKYNHLNLPVEINFTPSTRKIFYLYNANGEKVKKMVTTNGTSYTTTDYLKGYQYQQIGTAAVKLLFFPHTEGYVSNTVTAGINNYDYVFNYVDHLGNARVSYVKDINNTPYIFEENHYYPFGLKHTKYNIDQFYYDNCEFKCIVPVTRMPNQYKFQGQEWQDELGLNIYFFKFRMSDPATGRFLQIDPLSPTYPHNSTYAFAENNVTNGTDLEGCELSFQLNGSRATLVAGPRTDTYTLQEVRSIVAKKQAQEDKALGRILGGDPRKLPLPDIHLPQGDIRRAKFEDPSMMMADGALIGAEFMAMDAGAGKVIEGIGALRKGKSIWGLNALERGREAESRLGGNLGWNFPKIDKLENGIATSIKSLDLTAPSYQKGNAVLNTLKGYINKLSSFSETTWGGATVREGEQFTSKALEIAVQTGKGTESQWNQISQAINYALQKDINVTIRFIK